MPFNIVERSDYLIFANILKISLDFAPEVCYSMYSIEYATAVMLFDKTRPGADTKHAEHQRSKLG